MITAEHKTAGYENNWRCLPSEIDRIKREKLATGFRIWIDPTDDDFDKCLAGRDGIIVDFWLHMPRARDWAEKHRLPLRKYVDTMVDSLLARMKTHGNRVWWCLYGEHDNHIELPFKFKTRQAVHDYMKALVTTSLGIKKKVRFPGSTVNGKVIYNGLPQPFEYLKQRGINFKRANIAVQCGLGSYAHYLYEMGPRLAWLEINCGLPNVQVELAFLRGAARQYRGYWGIDMSSWGMGIPLSLTTVYDRDGTLISGVHPSLHLREMLAIFLTGANLIHQEMTEISFWIDKKFGAGLVRFGHDHGKAEEWFDGIEKVNVAEYVKPDRPGWFDLGRRDLKLSPTGKASQQMVDLARRHPELRKHPCRPIGLLMEYYHGWTQNMASYNKVWYGNNDYEKGDFMVKAFFEAAFPDYLGLADGWSKLWAEGYYPTNYETRVKYNFKGYSALARKGFDFRPYDNKELVSGRWGDIFDVILENCDPAVLQDYPFLVVLGRLVPDKKMEKNLIDYTRKGGAVFTSVSNCSPAFLAKLGISFRGEQQHLNGECLACGRRFTGKFHRVLEPEDGIKMEKIALTFDGRPLIVRKHFGQGSIYLSLVPYGLAGDNSGLLEIVKHFLDHQLNEYLPVEVKGGPIQRLINTPPGATVVTLINNSPAVWQGSVLFKKRIGKATGITELWNERPMAGTAKAGGTLVNLRIQPFDFKVVCARHEKSRK